MRTGSRRRYKQYKRGDLVSVTFTGKVINEFEESIGGVRISVDGCKPAWWAVVPSDSVTLVKEKERK